MKILLLSMSFTFLALSIYGQDESASRYITDLQKAETLQDTIAAWITFKVTATSDIEKSEKLLNESLKTNHPLWAEIEKAKMAKDSSYNISKLKEFVESSKDPSLYKYGLMLLRQEEIKEGKSNEVNYDVLLGDMTKPKTLVFNYYLKASQYLLLQKTDSLLICMEKLTNDISEDVYSGLQLRLITITLDMLFARGTDEADAYLAKGLRLSERLNEFKNRSNIYNAKVSYLKRRGDIEGAMKAGLQLIEINEKAGDIKNMINGYLSLSNVHQEQGSFEVAYKLIYKARELAEANNEMLYLERTYATEAFCKKFEKKYDEAISLLQRCVNSDLPKMLYSEALMLINLIDCYYMTSKIDSAYLYYSILEKKDPQNSTGILSHAKTYVIEYLVQKGDFNLAQEYIDTGLADAELYKDLSATSICLRAQSVLDVAKGDYKNALKNYKEHERIEHDFTNEQFASTITKLQLESDFENEKKVIALTNEKEKLQITSQRNQALFLGGIALLTALSALGFYIFIRRKNKQINIQNQKLEDLNNVKDTLFQIIGHDLKKPSINFRNVSKNINYLLEKKDYKRLQALGAEVDQDAKSLYNLTDNLLNWALMQKDTVRIKPQAVNIQEVVSYNVDLFQSLAKRKNIQLTNNVATEITAEVDRNSVDTIVRNLIDNAIKYTQESGSISIYSETKSGMVQIKVKDTGLGMSKAVMDEINAAQTVQSTKGTEGEKGSGIGLQLVKQLVDKNKGSLYIESRQGEGSVISIQLPLAS